MRNVYEKKRLFNDIQQGVIINGCIAEDYNELDVFGVIITPRCDIDHCKVSTVHYLPIVCYEDWLKKDAVKIFQERERKKLLNKLTKLLEQNKISPSILSNNITKDDILKAASSLKSKILMDFEKDIIELHSLVEHEYALNAIKNWKDNRSLIKELIAGNNSAFYLIEDWDNPSKFKIILLREVRRLKFELALGLKNGVDEHSLSGQDWIKNDLSRSHDSSNLYCTIAKITSPYIEHLLQSFYYNFGRIGVDDFVDNLDESILTETNKILNI